jgi:hypothetical protein
MPITESGYDTLASATAIIAAGEHERCHQITCLNGTHDRLLGNAAELRIHSRAIIARQRTMPQAKLGTS